MTTNTNAAPDNCTILPDGSAFALASCPLPKDHWLYAPREYEPGAEEPKELPHPILTHAQSAEVVAAVRYAIRGATMCGKEEDFDPDALVQNAVYALCGPFKKTSFPLAAQPPAAPQEELHEYEWALYEMHGHRPSDKDNWHAGGTATTQAEAEREAAHYLGQYANDDTGFRFEVFEVTRKSLGGLARLPDA